MHNTGDTGNGLADQKSNADAGLYYYRARYYDLSLGRFLNEDPFRFGGGENFYRYVGNNPVRRKDPLGLWQFTMGGGMVLGAQLTFGQNNGQWNFGLASGVGQGFFADYDPMDSGGCHKFYAGGETTAHGGIGLGAYGVVDDNIPWDGGPPNLDVRANFPGVGGVSWSPDHPLEPPHGVIGGGEGGFAGIGFRTYSVPTRCDCPKEWKEHIDMKRFWIVLNSVLIALAFRGGYISMNPDRLRHTNPEPILCLIILLVMPLFPLGAVAYSIGRWKSDQLPRPSWSRNPLGWWRDPLQSLFIFTFIMAAMAIGSAFQKPTFGSVGFWTLGVYVCIAIGLFVGQILVYRIYRQRIASSWVGGWQALASGHGLGVGPLVFARVRV
jgi:RHS repeat-associated protein